MFVGMSQLSCLSFHYDIFTCKLGCGIFHYSYQTDVTRVSTGRGKSLYGQPSLGVVGDSQSSRSNDITSVYISRPVILLVLGVRNHNLSSVPTPQTVVYKKGSEFPQKFLIYQLGGGYEMINLM